MIKKLLTVIISLTLFLCTTMVSAHGENEPVYTEFNYYWAESKLNVWIENNDEVLDDARTIYPNTKINRGEFVFLLEEAFEILNGNLERIYYNLPELWWTDQYGVIDIKDVDGSLEEVTSEEATYLIGSVFEVTNGFPTGFFNRSKQATVLGTIQAIQAITKDMYKNEDLYILSKSPLGINILDNSSFDVPLSLNIPDENGYVNTEDSWILFENSGGTATSTTDNGMLRVDVINNDGVPDYGIQLMQSPIELVKGDVYKIIFDAKSTDERDISVKIGSTGDKGWLAYNAIQTVTLDENLSTYSLEFIMSQPDDANARFELFFGASTLPVWIDNIKMYKVDHMDLITLDDLLNRTNTEEDEDLVEDWHLVWNDEFDGTTLNNEYWNYDTGWGPYDNGWGNFELEYYTEDNVTLEDGKLVIKVTEEERTVYESDGKAFTTKYSSGRINTKNKITPKYGRIEVSAKLLEGDAIWPAVWMIGSEWPDQNSWPEVGEIDIVELLGQEPSKIYGTVHSPLSYQNGFAGEGQTYTLDEGTFADSFHEYVIEWDEDEIEYYIDGIPFHIINKDEVTYKYGPGNWAFDHEFYFIMNVAVGGFFPGEPNENTIVPNQMEIDYIRLYEDVNPLTVENEVVDSANELPIPTPELDKFTNGTFDTGLDSWETYIHYDALADINVENSEAKISISSEGNEFWGIQLYQGPFNLYESKSYTVEFDARADVARKLEVIAENAEYNVFLNEVVDLSDTINTYTLEFTMPSTEEVSLKFMLGKIGDAVGLAHNVFIDNVKFYESAPKVKEVTDFSNGTFDSTLAPWAQYIHYDALANINVENGEAVINIESAGNESWGIQLYQGEFNLHANTDYVIEFDARSDMARDIQLIVDNTGYYAYLSEIVSINEEMNRYSLSFTAAEDLVTLKFILGNVNGTIGSHNVYIDNVSFKVKEVIEEPAVPQLQFDENLIDNTLWTGWYGDEWSGYSDSTLSINNDQITIDITTVGNASYSPQVFQEGLLFENGEDYIVTFNAYATEPKPININIGKPLAYDPWFLNYTDTKSYNLTTEPTNYMFKFTMNEQTYDNGKIVFELGTINGDTTSTRVNISNVNVVKVDNSINNLNWTSWWGDEWSGYSSGTLTVIDDNLTVDLSTVGWASYSPQIIQDGLLFETGKEYLVMFDAKSVIGRPINVQVGRGIDYDPWFIPYTNMKTYNLTNEYTKYAFNFIMNEETYNNGKIVLELGTINNESVETTIDIKDLIIIDNARIIE